MFDFNKIFQSKAFKTVNVCLVGLIVFLLIFGTGMAVGFRKAAFSFKWGENYHNNFGGPPGGMMGEFRGRDLIDAHGVAGTIIKIDGNSLVIAGQNNVETIVLLTDKTVINQLRENIQPADLRVDENIVVIGEPNDQGQIEAKLIRVLPPLPTGELPPAPGQQPPAPLSL
ncbi:MAG: hypothetical protein WCT37_03930 [Patescibacteria group bacterium]|jgi:hypothetical protein